MSLVEKVKKELEQLHNINTSTMMQHSWVGKMVFASDVERVIMPLLEEADKELAELQESRKDWIMKDKKLMKAIRKVRKDGSKSSPYVPLASTPDKSFGGESSPYKPLGHKENCRCSLCKLVREWRKKQS